MISVVIPVYNTEKYLERCINSVLENTYNNIEVICVDDGSTDNSLMCLRKLAEQDKRLIIISQDNQGVSIARNTGIAEARGEYLVFVDSDDWIHPQFFELLLNCQEKSGADIAVCGYKSTSEEQNNHPIVYDDRKVMLKTIGQSMGDYHIRQRIWGRVYSRKCIGAHLFPPDVRIGEDTIFNIAVMCGTKNLKVCHFSEELYYYFQREDSAVHSVPHKEIIRVSEWCLERLDTFSDDAVKKALLVQALKSIYASRYLSMFDVDRWELKERCNALLREGLLYMSKMKDFSWSEKVKYKVFALSPLIYRAYRIIGDKTLLQWEKNSKTKMMADH